MTSNKDLKYTNEDINTKILIVRKMISFYERIIEKQFNDSLKVEINSSLTREKKHLNDYKEKYPEFFI